MDTKIFLNHHVNLRAYSLDKNFNKNPLYRFIQGVLVFIIDLCFAVTAENIYYFVLNHFFDVFSGRLQILTRVEMIGMLIQIFSDSTCHS